MEHMLLLLLLYIYYIYWHNYSVFDEFDEQKSMSSSITQLFKIEYTLLFLIKNNKSHLFLKTEHGLTQIWFDISTKHCQYNYL